MIKNSFYSILNFLSKIAQQVFLINLVNANLNPGQVLNFFSFQNYFQILSGVASGGVNTGLVKLISSNYDKKYKYVLTSVYISVFFTILAVIYIVFLDDKSFGIEGGVPRLPLILFVIFSAIGSLLSAFMIGVFRANNLIVINFLSILFSLGALKFYFDNGSLMLAYFVAGFQSLFLVIFFYGGFYRKVNTYAKELINNKFEISTLLEIRPFVAHSILWAVVTPMFYILSRELLLVNHGVDLVLNWEMLTKISQMMFLFNSSIVGMYVFPLLSKTNNNQDLKLIIYKALKWCFVINIAVLMIILIGFDFFMTTLLNYKQKIPITDTIMYLLGEIFRSGSWVLMSFLTSKGRIINFWIFELSYRAFIIFCLYFLSDFFDFNAYYFIYLLFSFLLFISLFVFHIKKQTNIGV
jgi:O-antigen/teichoic acid export membrane protein